jgi:cytoskeletal protein RodZ
MAGVIMSTLGEVLKEARQEKKLSLEELQEMTKIQKRYLLAIEQGKYEQLPGKFYARAFIKNYAEAVGLHHQQLFEEYPGDIPSTGRETPENLPSRANRKTAPMSGMQSKMFSFIPKLLVVILIFSLLVTIWVVVQNRDSGGDPEQSGDDDSPIEVNNGEGIPKNSEEENGSSQGQSDEQQSGENKTEEKKLAEEPEPEQELVKTGSEGRVTNYTLKNTDAFQLELAVEDSNSWIEIRETGPGGEKLVYDGIKAGDTVSLDLSEKQKVYINIGRTPQVTMSINGEPFTYPNDQIHQQFYFTIETPPNEA